MRENPLHEKDDDETNSSDTNLNGKDELLFVERSQSWKVFAFGQFTALCLAINSAAASTIGSYFGLRIPVSQTGLAYFLLSFHLLWLPKKEETNDVVEPEENHQNNNGIISSNDDSRHDFIIIENYNQQQQQNYTKKKDGAFQLSFWFWKIRLKKPLWMYFLAAFLDVQANYIFVMSFQYTSITSASLLSSMCVPATMLTSKFLLKRIFIHWHFIGVGICLLGAILMVWSDIHSDTSGDTTVVKSDENNHHSNNSGQFVYTYAYWGDILAISGAFLYGFNDTIVEYFVSRQQKDEPYNNNNSGPCDTDNDRIEYLALLGFFGTLISIVQSYLVGEWDHFWTLLSHFQLDLLYFTLLWYAVSLAIFYISVSIFLQISESTLLTLSLQSEDMWATLFSIFGLQHHIPSILFFIAALLEISGVCLYELLGNNEARERERQKPIPYLLSSSNQKGVLPNTEHEISSTNIIDDGTPSFNSKLSPSFPLSYGTV